MPKSLDPIVADLLKEHFGTDAKNAVWDVHGTWVIYHRYVERLAAAEGIVFDMPQVIENDSAKGVAIVVRARMLKDGKEREAWATGEAAPSNNKNLYPWAMAEKRAVDRAALKLLGLAGFVYSEEEADDFKKKPGTSTPEPEVSEYFDMQERLTNAIKKALDIKHLQQIWKENGADLAELKKAVPEYYNNVEFAKEQQKKKLEQQ